VGQYLKTNRMTLVWKFATVMVKIGNPLTLKALFYYSWIDLPGQEGGASIF
jgi:hypothetical protein